MQVILRKILFLSPVPLRSCCDAIIFWVIASTIRHILNRFALIEVPPEHCPVTSSHTPRCDSSHGQRLLQN